MRRHVLEKIVGEAVEHKCIGVVTGDRWMPCGDMCERQASSDTIVVSGRHIFLPDLK